MDKDDDDDDDKARMSLVVRSDLAMTPTPSTTMSLVAPEVRSLGSATTDSALWMITSATSSTREWKSSLRVSVTD